MVPHKINIIRLYFMREAHSHRARASMQYTDCKCTLAISPVCVCDIVFNLLRKKMILVSAFHSACIVSFSQGKHKNTSTR